MSTSQETLRNEVHLALIQAGVGDAFQGLVDGIDLLVIVAVIEALERPPEIPF